MQSKFKLKTDIAQSFECFVFFILNWFLIINLFGVKYKNNFFIKIVTQVLFFNNLLNLVSYLKQSTAYNVLFKLFWNGFIGKYGEGS
jgi:hypothetical protein